MAAQLVHAGLEGDAGPGGIFLKDHGQGLPFQNIVWQAVGLVILHLVGHIQNVADILAGEIQQLEQVLFHVIHLIFPGKFSAEKF